MSQETFPIDAWWASSKIVFIEEDFAQIRENYACALGVQSKDGDQFFIAQKLYTKDGNTYILEKYDHTKNTLFYRRKK